MFNSLEIENIPALLTKKYLFPLLAFAIPLLLRAIPEVLMGPYIVGFDTMGFYVPTTLLWLRGAVDAWSIFSVAPLFYSIVAAIVSSGAPIDAVLKVIPPLLHGLLGLSIYVCAKRGLGWSPFKSIFTALLATIYFVALRVSWDLLRNELALILFFPVLTLLSMKWPSQNPWKRYTLLALTMTAVVSAHQLVSVIMLGVVVFTLIHKLFRKNYGQAIKLFLVSLPATVFFAFIYFSSAAGYRSFDFSMNDAWPLSDFSSYRGMLSSEAGLFFYCYLPLLPLAIISVKRFNNFQFRSWLVLSFILLLIPIPNLSNFRWVLMLVYPLAFYVSETLSRLRRIAWKRFKLTVFRGVIVYLVLMISILGLGLMLNPPERPFAYFDAGQYNGYIYQMPSSMLQNTVSITDCQDTTNTIRWFRNNVQGNAILLTHRAFYGWALLTLSRDNVVLYEFENPAEAAENMTREGHNQIYLIWWVNGTGWYGLPNVSSPFEEVYRSGRMAIYGYKPSGVT